MKLRAAVLYLASGFALAFSFLAWAILGTNVRTLLIDPFYAVLVVLPILFGLVQPLSQLSQHHKILLALPYVLATAVVLVSWLSRNELDADWPAFFIVSDMLVPVALLLPAGFLFVSVVQACRKDGDMSARIYLVGGLFLCVAIIVRLWYGAVAIWLLPSGGIGAVTSALFAYPIALLLSILSVCFGLLPAQARPGVPWAICYLCGAVLLSIGAHVAVLRLEFSAPEFLISGLGLMAPSFFVAIYRLSVSGAEVVAPERSPNSR